MDAEAARSYSLEQIQALYSFPFQQMMAEVPNMAVTTGQQVPAVAPNMATVTEQQVPEDAPVQEPAPGSSYMVSLECLRLQQSNQ